MARDVFMALEDRGKEHRQVRRFKTAQERDEWVRAKPNRRVVRAREARETSETPTRILRVVRLRRDIHDRLDDRARQHGRTFDAELQRILEIVLG